jgi:pyruvate dehydrogenase E2 component (dihydrolipoamide acetyltransferase)
VGLTVRERRELTLLRRIIAQRLGQSSREAIHVTLHRDVSTSALLALRAEEGEVRPSIEDFVIKACALSLQEYPAFNALFTEGTHQIIDEVNIGIAVDTERGLVVPVLKDVHRLTLLEIAARRADLVQRTKQWRHRPEDLEEGTFTLSNLGPLGVDAFTPIINPPQVAILGVGRIRERSALDGGELRAKTTMTLSLSFDHRVVDGADAARFLQGVTRGLEAPEVLVRSA